VDRRVGVVDGETSTGAFRGDGRPGVSGAAVTDSQTSISARRGAMLALHEAVMSQESGPSGVPTCAHCGAPDNGEFVACRFCKQAVSAEAQRTAIPCPHCKMLCRWGKQKCGQCQAWIVVSCVFCGALSPHNISNCLRCDEAFAGAPQRKAAMEQQRQHAQNMQSASVWGNVASSFVGAAAGVAVVSAFTGGHSHNSCSSYDSCSSSSSEDTFDISGVTDDSSFDFGGGSDW
jgi:hypothetical protein